MAKNSIALAAKAFSEKWATHGDEKGEAQKFWLELLQTVLGVPNPSAPCTTRTLNLPINWISRTYRISDEG